MVINVVYYQVKFYRHLRFLDHGYVLYSLDIVEPVDMARHLYPATPIPKRIFEGRYTLTKREVVVEVGLQMYSLLRACRCLVSFLYK